MVSFCYTFLHESPTQTHRKRRPNPQHKHTEKEDQISDTNTRHKHTAKRRPNIRHKHTTQTHRNRRPNIRHKHTTQTHRNRRKTETEQYTGEAWASRRWRQHGLGTRMLQLVTFVEAPSLHQTTSPTSSPSPKALDLHPRVRHLPPNPPILVAFWHHFK